MGSGPIDEPDDDTYDGPLHKISDRLLDGQLEADVQVYVVMHDKRADGKDTDESAETRTFDCAARASGIGHRVEHCDRSKRHKHREHAEGHRAFYAFL